MISRTKHCLTVQRGLTLVELMISIALGLFVAMAATSLLVYAKSGYVIHAEQAQLQETGRMAIEVIARAVRQAAYANWDSLEGPVVKPDLVAPAFAGLDAKSLTGRTHGIDSPLDRSVNGSDVLAIRVFGAGSGENGDGTMLNCAGFGVGAPTSSDATADDLHWNIFYVSEDATGEPELYCKYLGNDSWASQAIARGVESFQVLYGLDTDGDLVPNQFMSARAIDALDAADADIDGKKRSHWNSIVTIKISLLVRGSARTRIGEPERTYDLFGDKYSDASAAADPGVRIQESELPRAVRQNERKVFTSTVQLRSAPHGGRG